MDRAEPPQFEQAETRRRRRLDPAGFLTPFRPCSRVLVAGRPEDGIEPWNARRIQWRRGGDDL